MNQRPQLTSRQTEIVALLTQGHLNNREIGDRLGLRHSTVRQYVHHILQLTGTRNRAHLMLLMHQQEIDRLSRSDGDE